MQRINVVGTSGSGKSHFSQRLAHSIACDYIEMDQLYWEKNWQEPSDEVFIEKLKTAISGESWVLDGNYNRTVSVKLAKADTIVWIDYSFSRTLYQAVKRALIRCLTKVEIGSGTGNTENFRKSFMSRDSVLLWTLKTYQSNKVRYQTLMENETYQDIHFVRLTSPAQAKSYIEMVNQMKRTRINND